MKFFRKLLVKFNLSPCSKLNEYVAAYNNPETGIAVIVYVADSFLKQVYVDYGIASMVESFVKEIYRNNKGEPISLIHKSKIPLSREYRDVWKVDHKNKTIVTPVKIIKEG